MLFDLHLHSAYSLDALTKPTSIVKKCKKNNWGFSLTDHNNMRAYASKNPIQKIAKKEGVFMIPGEEVKIFEKGKCVGEVIGYFLNEEVKPSNFEEVIDDIRSQGALLSCPHPFDWLRNNLTRFEKEWKKFDCMETYNARSYYKSLNNKSAEFAKNKKIALLGVSDAHTPEEIGNGLTEINAVNENEFRKQIKKQKTKPIENYKAGLWDHFQTQLAKKNLVKNR